MLRTDKKTTAIYSGSCPSPLPQIQAPCSRFSRNFGEMCPFFPEFRRLHRKRIVCRSCGGRGQARRSFQNSGSVRSPAAMSPERAAAPCTQKNRPTIRSGGKFALRRSVVFIGIVERPHERLLLHGRFLLLLRGGTLLFCLFFFLQIFEK